MTLRDRINHSDRRAAALPVIVERRAGVERREPFVAPWRRRQIELAGGDRFRAVTDTTESAA
jgi:hypothetical protein